jgi:hypothetical protein
MEDRMDAGRMQADSARVLNWETPRLLYPLKKKAQPDY